jgi:hypothetical protein
MRRGVGGAGNENFGSAGASPYHEMPHLFGGTRSRQNAEFQGSTESHPTVDTTSHRGGVRSKRPGLLTSAPTDPKLVRGSANLPAGRGGGLGLGCTHGEGEKRERGELP